MKKEIKRVEHEFPSFIPTTAEILILGSFPSIKSREYGFYYMHPQNRFYRILSAIFQEDFYNCSIEKKKELLTKYKIALYDVVLSCDIVGSSDESIEHVQPIELSKMMKDYPIQHIFLNGKKAASLFRLYFKDYITIASTLPSTSPANCRYSLSELIEEWKVIKK